MRRACMYTTDLIWHGEHNKKSSTDIFAKETPCSISILKFAIDYKLVRGCGHRPDMLFCFKTSTLWQNGAKSQVAQCRRWRRVNVLQQTVWWQPGEIHPPFYLNPYNMQCAPMQTSDWADGKQQKVNCKDNRSILQRDHENWRILHSGAYGIIWAYFFYRTVETIIILTLDVTIEKEKQEFRCQASSVIHLLFGRYVLMGCWISLICHFKLHAHVCLCNQARYS